MKQEAANKEKDGKEKPASGQEKEPKDVFNKLLEKNSADKHKGDAGAAKERTPILGAPSAGGEGGAEEGK